MAKLVWRVKLVAELEPGVVTETELARIERDAQAGLAELGLQLDEAKRLTAALQARLVPAPVAASGACRRACEACGRALASKGHYGGAPWQGGAFQWVQAPPGELAPAGSDRSSHGGNEMAEAFD